MKPAIVSLLFFFFVSCTPSQKIAYDTKKILPEQQYSAITLSIQTFGDIRSQFEINEMQLAAKKFMQKIDGKSTCINAELLYKTPVNEQLTELFTTHLQLKNIFANVLLNQKEQADYYIEADVKHFTGQQQLSSAAVAGAQFGLIGALATMGAKSDGHIAIELSNIRIFDKMGNMVTMLDDFRKEYDGKFPATASCACIYYNINQKLYEFNEELTLAIHRKCVEHKGDTIAR